MATVVNQRVQPADTRLFDTLLAGEIQARRKKRQEEEQRERAAQAAEVIQQQIEAASGQGGVSQQQALSQFGGPTRQAAQASQQRESFEPGEAFDAIFTATGDVDAARRAEAFVSEIQQKRQAQRAMEEFAQQSFEGPQQAFQAGLSAQGIPVEQRLSLASGAAKAATPQAQKPITRVISSQAQLDRLRNQMVDPSALEGITPSAENPPRVSLRRTGQGLELAGFNQNRPASTNINLNPETFSTKALQERFEANLEASDNAIPLSSAAERLGNLMARSGAETGTIQPVVTWLQGVSNDLGFDLGQAARSIGVDSIGDLSTKEQIDRLSNRLVLDVAPQLKGNLNKQEFSVLTNSMTNLGRSEAANITAAATIKAAADVARESGAELLDRMAQVAPQDQQEVFTKWEAEKRQRRTDLIKERTRQNAFEFLNRMSPEDLAKFVAKTGDAGWNNMPLTDEQRETLLQKWNQ